MFDLLVILVIGLSTLFAAMRGGLRELATLIALAAAAFIALLLTEPILGAIGKTDSFFATIFAAAAVVAIAFIALHTLTHLGLKRMPLEGRVALADRIGGGIFGFARGLVLVGLGFLAYGYYLNEERQPDSVKNAITRPLAAGMADWFENFTPQDAYIENENTKGVPTEEDAAVIGYERIDRNGLTEVITTVTTNDDGSEDATPSDDPIADLLAEEDSP